MADLSGTVPPYYRDIYDVLCPANSEKISRQVFTKVMMMSGLENNILSQIWDCIECKGGNISRENLYKALALLAFAQQGKSVNVKLLENFAGQELPRPTLGEMSEIKAIVQQSKKSPTILDVTYSELCSYDKIDVKMVPEKKGIFLKHVEYEVISKKFNSSVLRRYNDFLAFHEVLQARFPYRMLPKLPPKKVMGSNDKQFIEIRRRALRRFLNLIRMHPAMYDDASVRFFVTFSGNEVVHKIKEQFRGCADEFMMSPLASHAKDLVPSDTQAQFASSRDQIKNISSHVQRMRDIVTRISERSKGNAIDLKGFGEQLIAIGTDHSSLSSWATGNNSTLQTLKQTFRGLSMEFTTIGEKHRLQGIREEEGLVEELNMLYDLLQAYHDLCDRHERGIVREHQSSLKKYGVMKNKRMAQTVQNAEQGAIDKIESKIVAQENEIAIQENRNYYSLHCIHLETQLVHVHMEALSNVVTTLVATQIKGHQEMSKLWEDLTPRVSLLVPNGDTSKPSSPRSLSPPPGGII